MNLRVSSISTPFYPSTVSYNFILPYCVEKSLLSISSNEVSLDIYLLQEKSISLKHLQFPEKNKNRTKSINDVFTQTKKDNLLMV